MKGREAGLHFGCFVFDGIYLGVHVMEKVYVGGVSYKISTDEFKNGIVDIITLIIDLVAYAKAT